MARAQDRARQLGHGVLASYTARIEVEGWPAARGEHYFVWEQPERCIAMLALGEAARIAAEGESRFEIVRGELDRLLGEAISEAEAGIEPGPVCLGGFGFDPSRPDDGAWPEFPDALVVAPELLFRRHDGVATLTLSALVAAETDLEAVAARLRHEVKAALSVPQGEAAHASVALTPVSTEDHEVWAASVRALTEQIGRERVEKVVLARRLEVSAATAFDVNATLERLRERYRNCTIFATGSGGACFLGATPELLVRREGRAIRADCMAGSAKRGRDAAADEALGAALLADEKELREHALVTTGIRESLAGLCEDVRLPETPTLRRMANVQHLHTPIEATTGGERHVLEFVEALHPTPAVAGLPRGRSLCLIREREGFGRGWYAGPIGWMDAKGDGEFAVALRSALVRGEKALLYAGCGIVAGSDPGREYAESAIKLEAMLWALSGS